VTLCRGGGRRGSHAQRPATQNVRTTVHTKSSKHEWEKGDRGGGDQRGGRTVGALPLGRGKWVVIRKTGPKLRDKLQPMIKREKNHFSREI